jgi:hypothetical protein
MLGRAGGFRTDELYIERHRDPPGDLFLKSEQIVGVALEPLCPHMRVGLSVNELDVDASLLARPLDAPFEHIAHTELGADLLPL